MNTLRTMLLAGGAVFASTLAADAQSPCYPAPRGDWQVQQAAYTQPPRYVASRPVAATSSCCEQSNPFYLPQQTVLPPGNGYQVARPLPAQTYPARQTAYYAPSAGVPIATRVVPATTKVRRGTVVGRGILGQPTAYVRGQPLRNAWRWITP